MPGPELTEFCNDSVHLWYGICSIKVSQSKPVSLCTKTWSDSKLSSLMAHCLQDEVQMSQNAQQFFTNAADQRLPHHFISCFCTIFLWSMSHLHSYNSFFILLCLQIRPLPLVILLGNLLCQFEKKIWQVFLIALIHMFLFTNINPCLYTPFLKKMNGPFVGA